MADLAPDEEVTFEHDGVRYPFSPTMSGLEVIALKNKTGLSWKAWVEGFQDMDAEAIRWLIWVSLTRAGKQPECKYSEFDYDYTGFLGSIEGPEQPEDVEPDPTPARRSPTSRKKSSVTGR